MLGDLGADVVKVEPPGGDPLRVLSEAHNRPGTWTLVSRSKRMITVDTAGDEGLDVLHRLTAVADVVTLNQPRPLLARMGCAYEDIAARNPRAVVVSASTFGSTGPYADRTGSGTVAEAFAGLTDLLRDGEGRPIVTPVLFGDHLTASAGVVATLAACYWRDARGGRGQLVDLTQYEAIMSVLGPQLLGWSQPPATNDAPGSGVRGAFQTSDGSWVLVTAYSDAQISRVVDTAGADGRPGTGGDLSSMLAAWIAARDQQAVVGALRSARVQVSPVNDLRDLMADPQVSHRQSVVEVDDPVLGVLRFPRPTPLSESPPAIRWRNPSLGADTAQVLAEWLA
jgi:crotonobetainyl-CoA:carnitine CoA-transferase CaiB-like acyl-CoA transferase